MRQNKCSDGKMNTTKPILTELQRRVVKYLADQAQQAFPPSFRDIQDALRLSSVSQAHGLVARLRALGVVAPADAPRHGQGAERTRARGIRLAQPPAVLVRRHESLPMPSPQALTIRACAQGRGTVWIRHPAKWQATRIPVDAFEQKADFLVEIGNDAEVQPRFIHRHDYVAVAEYPAPDFPVRQIVAVRKGDIVHIGQGLTHKVKGRRHYRLEVFGEDGKTRHIPFSKRQLLGLVVGVVRRNVTWAQRLVPAREVTQHQ